MQPEGEEYEGAKGPQISHSTPKKEAYERLRTSCCTPRDCHAPPHVPHTDDDVPPGDTYPKTIINDGVFLCLGERGDFKSI